MKTIFVKLFLFLFLFNVKADNYNISWPPNPAINKVVKYYIYKNDGTNIFNIWNTPSNSFDFSENYNPNFTYSVTASNIYSLSKASYFTHLPPPNNSIVLSISKTTNNLPKITFSIKPGFSYTLESSSNFTNWNILANFNPLTNYTVEFVDSDTASIKFYRLGSK